MAVLALCCSIALLSVAESSQVKHSSGIPLPLFASLERFSRLVDITYCVGTTGLTHPFSCVSRCRDFPTLELELAWNTGQLSLSDSCGYVAVDHGTRWRRKERGKKREGDDGDEEPVEGAEKAIIAAFRGTYSITNTVVDLSTIPQEYVPYPSPEDGDGDEDGPHPPPDGSHDCANCTVHMGFLASWRAARKLVLPVLLPLREKHPDYAVHLVGHSLGGAVATLAALELRVVHGWDDVTVTTFGEPRIGNAALARFVDDVFGLNDNKSNASPAESRFRRVTHADDPVPLLPLAEWGFRSHSGEIYIAKQALPPGPEDVRFCDGPADQRCIAGGGHGGDGDGKGKQERSGKWWDRLGRRIGWRRGWRREDRQAVLDGQHGEAQTVAGGRAGAATLPARLKPWQLFFAHRDYFWRLGLCIPGGDPWDWGRNKYRYDDGDGKSTESIVALDEL